MFVPANMPPPIQRQVELITQLHLTKYIGECSSCLEARVGSSRTIAFYQTSITNMDSAIIGGANNFSFY